VTSTKSTTSILIDIGTKAAWAPVLVFVLHQRAANWLGHEPYVDPVMHFAGGMAIAFFFWQAAECRQRNISNLQIFGLTTLVAIGWELMEFSLISYRGWGAQWDLLNTLRDLTLGMGGAALIIFFITRSRRLGESLPSD
jgi:hypothetical protein